MSLTEEDLRALPGDGEGIDPDNPGKYAPLLEDLQGNILNSHGRNYSVYLLLQFKPERVAEVKQWIKKFSIDFIKSAKQQAENARRFREEGIDGGVFGNFFLSRKGYEFLGISPAKIPGDRPFRFGMKNSAIAASLGDPKVDTWETGYQGDIHALVVMADDDLVCLLQTVNRTVQSLRQASEILNREDGFILKNARGQIVEHFGFVDNISQPLFMKREIAIAKEKGSDFSKWDSRASLDLILTKDPNGKTEDSYGSYLVFRKLEQNVKGFREDQRQLAEKLGINEDLAGALAVGRFFDGTPVTVQDRPVYANPIRSLDTMNAFDYSDDMQGSRCPFHAHVRKCNPRGDTGRIESSVSYEESLAMERGHRIIRRGVSFGDNDLTQEPESGSGMLFLCFQADLENQFNFMQASWANQKNFPKINVGPDPLIGQPQGTQKWPKKSGENDVEEHNFSLWVTMKGGEYFFAPSLSFLLNL
ncbi:Dyp-type peroxidase [Oscillatoria sp. FACHB-1406]|uniref:Dyp-type peroxidase n=1 Tax=Oscillatoria sp. FACHB-1406 TaxID=2692846 RepID=UPI001684ACF2|nr:Dyp-type peroxidase [Oscillatoria sp. FACHB-1406]MBD2578385.1 Dyp-type peroxidase [Oscillatoria sp. FACHB-1406]